MRYKKMISAKHFAKVSNVIFAIYMALLAYEITNAVKTIFHIPTTFGLVYIGFILLSVSIILDSSEKRKSKKPLHIKEKRFMNTYLLYFAFSMFVWMLICLIFPITDLVKSIGTLSIIPLCAVIVFIGYIRTKTIVTKEYNIEIGQGQHKNRITLVSDIHLGYFIGPKHIRKLVKKINSTSPDIVLIAGDIFDIGNAFLKNKALLKETGRILSKIKASMGVYAVLGNHDPKVYDEELKKFFNIANIRLLNNELAEFKDFYVAGRTDGSCNERTSLEDIISNAVLDKPMIVLDHNPEFIDDAVKNHVELVLCGHTHRGQFFPVTVLTRLAHGKEHFYGCHKIEDTTAVITSGAGFFELPVRIGTDNEVVSIKLKS